MTDAKPAAAVPAKPAKLDPDEQVWFRAEKELYTADQRLIPANTNFKIRRGAYMLDGQMNLPPHIDELPKAEADKLNSPSED